MPQVYLLWVEAPEIAYSSQPGQFVTIRCGEGFIPLLRRPFSVHRINRGQLAILYAVVGQGTEWLSDRKAGEVLDILGPMGNGFHVEQSSQNLLLVAGGIGVAPLVSLADVTAAKGLSVKLVLGAKSSSQIYSDIHGAEVTIVTEDGLAGEKGMATDFISSLAGWADQVFACGPISMYHTMSKMSMGADRSVQVLLEGVIGCGVGACRGCAVETNQGMKLVCCDGPVFELKDIL